MRVLSVNKIAKWCQIVSNGRRYTCKTKEIDGKLYFCFKRCWHCVAEFIADNADELVREADKIISRPFKN